MKEQLISFETAKLAKEKGCDIPLYIPFDEVNGVDIICSQSLLQKWIREKHKLDIWMCKTGKHGERYQAEDITDKNLFCVWSSQNSFSTYEEALEEGLREALKLIKKKEKE